MSEPFLAEVRIVGFNFAPRGWAFCDGQLLPINQNQALFSLVGTTYGGDGRTTFALPGLRGRTPIHKGAMHPLGSKGGGESHPLANAEMPQHAHALNASANAADTPVPINNLTAETAAVDPIYEGGANVQAMAAGAVTTAGNSQAHQNMMPFLVLNYIIALQGLFPSRN